MLDGIIRKKVALFKPIRRNGTPIVGDENFAKIDGYIRITGFVTVDFPALGAGDSAQEAVELDRLSAQVEEDYRRKLQQIELLRAAGLARVLLAEKKHKGGIST